MTKLRAGYGTLIIIGGHEDKTGDKIILRALADRVGDGKLVVATVASGVPEESWRQYEGLLRRIGIKHLAKLNVEAREQALDEKTAAVLDDADALFFTGGDQLKITSQIGDTPVFERMCALFERGGTIAGTSAGASVMSETMLVNGESRSSPRLGDIVRMAPGLGFIHDMVIDQHFAERGRMGRLLGAVAQNPRMLGVGIDEDTAIVVSRRRFDVIGKGAVYVADGSKVTYSNVTQEEPGRTLSLFGVQLHVLSQGDTFDLATRTANDGAAEDVEKQLLQSA